VGSPEHLPIVRDGLRMILSVLGYSYFLKGSRIMRRTIPVGVPPAVSYTASNPIAVRTTLCSRAGVTRDEVHTVPGISNPLYLSTV